MEMNSRTHLCLGITAAACLAVTTVFAQNPVGQIPIPQPCTAEQIAAAKEAESQPAAATGRGRGGGRGGGVACHMPDPREGLKPGKYDAGEAALNMTLVKSMRQPEGMFDPKATSGRSLDYANSDLAFGMNGRLALQGNFH
jgi:hypothetical protein